MLLKFIKLFIVLILALFIGLAVYVMFFDINPTYTHVDEPLILENNASDGDSPKESS